MIEEYDAVPTENKRYFAQLVYMVPVNNTSTTSVTDSFTEEEILVLKDLIKTDEDVAALKELIANKDKLFELLNK